MNLSRQVLVLGKKANDPLKKKTVAIIGLGALGAVALELLVRSGIQSFIVIDRDIIEASNLQRQIIYTSKDVGKPKATIAKRYAQSINPQVKIQSYYQDLNRTTSDLITADLMLDCTDNLQTRFLINEIAKKKNIPWIHASAIGEEGFVYVITKDKPCLECILQSKKTSETCQVTGVLNTITTMIATVQVSQAMKILTNQTTLSELLYINLNNNDFIKIKVTKLKNCHACKNQFDYPTSNLTTLCGANKFKMTGNFDFQKVRKNLIKLGAKDYKTAIIFKDMTVFQGCVMIQADSQKKANTLYSKYIGN